MSLVSLSDAHVPALQLLPPGSSHGSDYRNPITVSLEPTAYHPASLVLRSPWSYFGVVPQARKQKVKGAGCWGGTKAAPCMWRQLIDSN